MINKTINTEFVTAYKAKDEVRVAVFRDIKSAFQNYLTSPGVTVTTFEEIPDEVVMQILKKIAALHKESIDTANGRTDIIEEHTKFLNVLNEYLPAIPTDTDIENTIKEILASGVEPIKKNMGTIINTVLKKLPMADGKKVAQLVSKSLN